MAEVDQSYWVDLFSSRLDHRLLVAFGRINCLLIKALAEHCVADSNLLILAIAHNFEELLVSLGQQVHRRLAEFALDCQNKLWLFEIEAIEEL
jgi:hypothetical protein